MNFLEEIKARAKKVKKTIVLPESTEIRTLKATEMILKEDLADIILIGDEGEIKEVGKGLDIDGATIINPKTFKHMEEYINVFVKLREMKGMTYERAKPLMEDPLFLGVMMVKQGLADGMVAGAINSTANVLRPSLQILKTAPHTKIVSSFFVIVVPNCEMGYHGTFVMGDCGLNQSPSAQDLAVIAKSSAQSFEQLVGAEPIVALLSHSTYGSAKHPNVYKVQEATKIAQENYPNLKVDGELQSDAALVPEVANLKAPGSEIGGHANVLIFPDLDAGNIGYKLVQRLAKADAYGPLTQGLAKPVNDLSRGCSAEDIVGVVAITAVQAQIQE
ncbi:phosphate acetyltransferase [Candidatus Epulonipiscium fishelsonii]|uniref:Phosphate acetyltransferase n=1 Tax=Candidatus Epulonipiscium fishelsonii TaxID=77094 RepID=A0ACC8XDX4_9FIRM|nr:phosphate acetyltransferase [Epulopiscium sp. SCG-B05WGA-EpuloA1]ONI41095.1 phosphate acetyltransferase [Epulopiscium sp. SCG-B11WGA-EpuloA1]